MRLKKQKQTLLENYKRLFKIQINENYRDTSDNLIILFGMLTKGSPEEITSAKEIIRHICEEVKEAQNLLDELIENALEDNLGNDFIEYDTIDPDDRQI